MTAASHIIHVDRRRIRRSGNQAAERVSYAGRRRNLQVQRFVTPGPIEAGIDPRIAAKRRLADDLAGGGRGSDPAGFSGDGLIYPARRTSCARIQGQRTD